MSAVSTGDTPRRLISLDAFRGVTIAGMILVNNPGSWRYQFGPVSHARWHGWTPTDLIFPFFLFIVGVAMTFSFDRRLAAGHSRTRLFAQVVRRSAIIFLLGLLMYGFPDWRLIGPYILAIVGLVLLYVDDRVLAFGPTARVRLRKVLAWLILVGAVAYFALDFGHFQATGLRVPGVLQRIAVCYFVASIIVMSCGPWGRATWAVVLLVGYWFVIRFVHPPAGFTAEVTGREGLLHEWIDRLVLGHHLYGERPDPEGLLSTFPAIATTLLGVLAGNWLHARRDERDKALGLFFMANVLLVAGAAMNCWLPINKKLWTSSYVVFTAGMALHFLAMCYWLIDVKGYRRWAWPFVVFGTNAIAVYVASSLGASILNLWKLSAPDGSTTSMKQWLFDHAFDSWLSPHNASLAFAIAYVLLWLVLLLPLYQRRIFIKV